MADTGSSAARGNAFKLFHSVVVLGAALGSGCGQAANLDPGALGGHSGASGGQPGASGGVGGQAGSTGGGPTIDLNTGGAPVTGVTPGRCDYAGAERGTPEAPLGPADCPSPEQLSCNLVPSGCRCDPTAPLAPTDCATLTQFNCIDFGLLGPACCVCDLGAPPDETACSHGWSCQSYDPPTGCQCNVVIL